MFLHIRTPELRKTMVVAVLQVACFLAAAFCGLSRSVDYFHHSSDILAGAVLGTAEAILFATFYGRFWKLPLWLTRRVNVPAETHIEMSGRILP
jgi:membrane-associated phospholipid phosphatase